MHYQYLESVIQTFRAGGLVDPRETFGCTEEEIAYLEAIHPFQTKLPEAFREFLQYGGKNIGDLRVAAGFYYDFIINSTRNLNNTFLREGYRWRTIDEKFPEDGLIFMNNQGYEFLFIRLNEGANPPVYHALEGNTKFQISSDQFSQYMLELAQNYKALHNNLSENVYDEVLNLKTTVLDIIDSLDVLKNFEGVPRFIDRYQDILKLIYDLQKSYRQNQLDKAVSKLKAKMDYIELFQELAIPPEEKQKAIRQMKQALQQFSDIKGKLSIE
jgi:hypothetical protein